MSGQFWVHFQTITPVCKIILRRKGYRTEGPHRLLCRCYKTILEWASPFKKKINFNLKFIWILIFRHAGSFIFISRQGMISLDLCLQLIPSGQRNQPQRLAPPSSERSWSPLTLDGLWGGCLNWDMDLEQGGSLINKDRNFVCAGI